MITIDGYELRLERTIKIPPYYLKLWFMVQLND